jgi:hypothetical protein
VKVFGYESLPYGSFVRGRRSQPESAHHTLGIHHQRHLEAVDPLGLGGAASEARLPSEEPLASFAGPHPHHRRQEGGIQNAVHGRRPGESSGESPLQGAHLGLSRARTLRLNWLWEQRFGK